MNANVLHRWQDVATTENIYCNVQSLFIMQKLTLPAVQIYTAKLDISSQLFHLRRLTLCEKFKCDNTIA